MNDAKMKLVRVAITTCMTRNKRIRGGVRWAILVMLGISIFPYMWYLYSVEAAIVALVVTLVCGGVFTTALGLLVDSDSGLQNEIEELYQLLERLEAEGEE